MVVRSAVDSLSPDDRATREGLLINGLITAVFSFFARFDYASCRATTCPYIARGRGMTLGQFMALGWGDCRHHNASLAVMMTLVGIQEASISNQECTLIKRDGTSASESHVLVRYRSCTGSYYTADAFFRQYDCLPIHGGIFGTVDVDGRHFAAVQAPGRMNVYEAQTRSGRGNSFLASQIGRPLEVTDAQMAG